MKQSDALTVQIGANTYVIVKVGARAYKLRKNGREIESRPDLESLKAFAQRDGGVRGALPPGSKWRTVAGAGVLTDHDFRIRAKQLGKEISAKRRELDDAERDLKRVKGRVADRQGELDGLHVQLTALVNDEAIGQGRLALKGSSAKKAAKKKAAKKRAKPRTKATSKR